jgi:hypothetical protein
MNFSNTRNKRGPVGRRLSMLCLTGLSLTFSAFNARAFETKLSMTTWERFTLVNEPKIIAQAGGVKDTSVHTTKGYFSIERGYLRLEPKFTDNIKGRFTMDFYSDVSGADFKKGAGLKMKEAYIDFANVIPFVPNHKITTGLIKTYFGVIYDWDYTTINKSPDDLNGIVKSSDFGVGLTGSIPAGYGEYQFCMYNGEGYEKVGPGININRHPALTANARVIPYPGITVGGSVFYEKHSLPGMKHPSPALVNDSTFPGKLAYAAVGRVAMRFVDVWATFMAQSTTMDSSATYNTNKFPSQSIMVMPIIKGKPLCKMLDLPEIDLDLVGRYDIWDGDTQHKENGKQYTLIVGGINWNILRDAKGKTSVALLANWEHKQPEKNQSLAPGAITVANVKPTDTYMLQLNWNFSNTLLTVD